jgi:hypothetical protein
MLQPSQGDSSRSHGARHRPCARAGYGRRTRISAARAAAQTQTPYFPGRLAWQSETPAEVGMNSAVLNEAVQLAIAADTPGTHDMTAVPQEQLRQGAVRHDRRAGEGSRTEARDVNSGPLSTLIVAGTLRV